MRYILTLLLLIMMPFSGIAQIGGEDEVYLNGDFIEARFNGGGIEKFTEFISQHLDNSKMTTSGKLVFTFTVAETGEMKNLRIVEYPDINMATEIIRVMKNAPMWQPAKRGGKPISVNIRFPMSFTQRKN